MEEAQAPDERARESPSNISHISHRAIVEVCNEYVRREDKSEDFWLEFQNTLQSSLEKIWDEDLAKEVAAAQRELQELQNFQKTQHEELINCRRELEADKVKDAKQRQWTESVKALLDKANMESALLREKSEQLSRQQAGYLEKRNALLKFNQQISSHLEFAKCKMDERKVHHEQILQELRQKLKQEQEITSTLIKENQHELHDCFKGLMNESEQADIQCESVEAELEIALQKQEEIRLRLITINKQLDEEEEQSCTLEKINQLITEMKEETQSNDAFLNAELIKEQNLQHLLEQKLHALADETSKQESLQQENLKLDERWAKELCNKEQSQKALELGIKELLVLKNQNKAKHDKMQKENADVEQKVQENMMMVGTMLKAINEEDKRITVLEEENASLQQKSNSLLEQIAHVKNNLSNNENLLESLSMTLQNLGKEVEDLENQSGQEMILYKDRLEMLSVQSEQMDFILSQMERKEKQLQMEQHILCEEWETLYEEQVNYHRTIQNENENRSCLKTSDMEESDLANQQQLTLMQIEILNEKCLKAEETKNDLTKQIELQEVVLERNTSERKALDQEIENTESSSLDLQAELSETEKEVQKNKENLVRAENAIAHLTEQFTELDSEIEALKNQLSIYHTAESDNSEEDKLELETQIQHVSERVSLGVEIRNSLEQEYNEVELKLKEIMNSREGELKNTEKEINALEAKLKEQEEYIEISKKKLSKLGKCITGNEHNCTVRNEQLEERKKRVCTLQNEISALKATLQSFQEETTTCEADLDAELEAIKTKLQQTKMEAEEGKRMEEAERAALVTELKQAQSHLKELVSTSDRSTGKIRRKELPMDSTERDCHTAQGKTVAVETPKRLKDAEGEKPEMIETPKRRGVAEGQKSAMAETPKRRRVAEGQKPAMVETRRERAARPEKPATVETSKRQISATQPCTPLSRPHPRDSDCSSSSSSSIILTMEERQQVRNGTMKATKLIAELRRRKRLKRMFCSQ